jgi:hypothetical protein
MKEENNFAVKMSLKRLKKVKIYLMKRCCQQAEGLHCSIQCQSACSRGDRKPNLKVGPKVHIRTIQKQD